MSFDKKYYRLKCADCGKVIGYMSRDYGFGLPPESNVYCLECAS